MHLQPITYNTIKSFSIKSCGKRATSPLGSSPRSKTLTQTVSKKKILPRTNSINDNKKTNFFNTRVKKQGILEKFDEIQRISKSISREFPPDDLNLNSICSSSRDANNEFQFPAEEDQDFSNNERALELLIYNKFFLNIKRPCKNLKEFKKEIIVNHLKESQIIFGIMLFFYSFQSVIDFFLHIEDLQEAKSATGFIRFFTNISLFFLSFFGVDKLFSFLALRIIFIVVEFVFLIVGILDYHNENDLLMKDVSLALLFCPVIFMTNLSFFNFREIIFINFGVLFTLIIAMTYDKSLNLENTIMTFVVLIHNIIKNYFQKRFHIKSFNNLKLLYLIREEQNEKLSQLLPIHVKLAFIFS